MRSRRWLPVLIALAAASPASADPAAVLLIGDSITLGEVSGPPGPPYAEVLASNLGDNYEVVNTGCGGTSSVDWTVSQPALYCGGVGLMMGGIFHDSALPHLPSHIASVLVGTNDALGYLEPEPVSAEAYRASVEEVVANLIAAGAGTVILLTPPDSLGAEGEERDRLLAYRAEIQSICITNPRVRCGPDVFNLLDPELDFEDGDIHPNAQGHAKLADAFAEMIEALHDGPPQAPALGLPGSALLTALILGTASWTLRGRRARGPE